MVDIVSIYYIVGTLVGLTVLLGAGWKFAQWLKKRGNNEQFFTFQKFKEHSPKPIESDWSIRILHPTKPIERCMVLYDNARLPWWDKVDEPRYEKLLVISGGGNVRIPKGMERDEARVIVKDGDRKLRETTFGKVPEA